MEQVTIDIYKLDELPAEIQEKIIQRERDDFPSCCDAWHLEHVTDDLYTALNLLGFSDIKPYYDLSYSQGAGACFEASYTFVPNALKEVKGEFPTDDELQDIAKMLDDLALTEDDLFTADVVHRGSIYYHANTVTTRLDDFFLASDEAAEDEESKKAVLAEETLSCAVIRLCEWYYQKLYDADQYEMSEEAIRYRINECYEWRFDKHGNIFID